MKRFECLQAIAPLIKNELFVTTAGGATAEWNAVRPSDGNIQVKTLGLCSSIGLGLAIGSAHTQSFRLRRRRRAVDEPRLPGDDRSPSTEESDPHLLGQQTVRIVRRRADGGDGGEHRLRRHRAQRRASRSSRTADTVEELKEAFDYALKTTDRTLSAPASKPAAPKRRR